MDASLGEARASLDTGATIPQVQDFQSDQMNWKKPAQSSGEVATIDRAMKLLSH